MKDYPIPKWCKKDCYFRDKKAKFMPACQYGGKLIVKNDICIPYKKE